MEDMGNNPLGMILQALQQMPRPGVPGQPVNYSQRSTIQGNPLIGNAMASLGAMGGAPAAMMGAAAPMGGGMGGMMGGQPNGYTVSHTSLSVQPGGKGSANDRYNKMAGRKQRPFLDMHPNAVAAARRNAGAGATQ